MADGNQLTWWKPCLEDDTNAAVFDSYGHEDQSHSDPWQAPHATRARTDTGTADHIRQALDCLSVVRERRRSILSLYSSALVQLGGEAESVIAPLASFVVVKKFPWIDGDGTAEHDACEFRRATSAKVFAGVDTTALIWSQGAKICMQGRRCAEDESKTKFVGR